MASSRSHSSNRRRADDGRRRGRSRESSSFEEYLTSAQGQTSSISRVSDVPIPPWNLGRGPGPFADGFETSTVSSPMQSSASSSSGGSSIGSGFGSSGGGGRKYRIAMVCDFFYPNVGGVESHVHYLAQCLAKRGHKVIIITHSYGQRAGVRYIIGGVKVYYSPFATLARASTWPSGGPMPLLRHIFIRERIDIVHGHQSGSHLSGIAILAATELGIRSCQTEHSLFGFSGMKDIAMNKIYKFVLTGATHSIGVSHTTKENMALRTGVDPAHISVIPNAVDVGNFTPDPSARDLSKVTIVTVSRLVPRKGIPLLIQVIPPICKAYPHVQFIVGGDGPLALELEEMRETHQLHDRVELVNPVPSHMVRSLLVRAQIYLNTSLTEAFGISLLEGASCGLRVVTTNVGGIPEVLPADMVRLAEPNPESIIAALSEAIAMTGLTIPDQLNQRVGQLYDWKAVAARTEVVYDHIMTMPKMTLVEAIRRFYSVGPVFGKFSVGFFLLFQVMFMVLDWLCPQEDIEYAWDVPHDIQALNRLWD